VENIKNRQYTRHFFQPPADTYTTVTVSAQVVIHDKQQQCQAELYFEARTPRSVPRVIALVLQLYTGASPDAVDNTGWGPQREIGSGPSPDKTWKFPLKRRFGAFWASWCGDFLDVTTYSSAVFILLQTDFTTETG